MRYTFVTCLLLFAVSTYSAYGQLNPTPESSEPKARVNEAGVFVAPNWRIKQHPDNLFALSAYTNDDAEFAAIEFASVEYISSVRSRNFQWVFRLADVQNHVVYELCYAETVNQTKVHQRWVARRIKAANDGLIINMVNRMGPPSGLSIDVTPGGNSSVMTIYPKTCALGDTYQLNDSNYTYPNLPPSPPGSADKAHTVTPGFQFHANTDPARDFLLIGSVPGNLRLTSHMGSSQQSSIDIAYGTGADDIAIYLAPLATQVPTVALVDASWVGRALQMTLDSGIDDALSARQKRIDSLLRMADKEGKSTDNEEIKAVRARYTEAMNAFDTLRGRMAVGEDRTALERWIRLGAALQEIKTIQGKIEDALIAAVVP